MARTKKGVQPQDSTPNGSAHDSAAMTEQDQGMPVADLEDSVLGNQRPAPFKTWKRRSLKMIVVGDSGLGKSTLIKALLSTPQERLQACSGDHDRFVRNPNSLCTSVSWRDDEDRITWTYTMQDTPGFGHHEDPDTAIRAVLDFIVRQNEARLRMEQSHVRAVDLEELDDPRIALCLYCIGPHRLRPIDLKYMYMIGQAGVPVVPVVTKADTMTLREAEVHRNLVLEKIANPMVPGVHGKINVFTFGRDSLERAGVLESWESRPPFMVIASDDLNESRINSDVCPTYWPERSYPWGTAQAFNPQHSDLLTLRALLFKEALEEIVRSKRQHYEAWRRRRLQGRWLKRKFWQLLAWLALPAAMFKLGQAI